MPAHVFSSSAMDSLPSAPRLVFLLNAPPFLRLHIPTFESGFSVCFHRFFHSISSTHIHGDQVVATGMSNSEGSFTATPISYSNIGFQGPLSSSFPVDASLRFANTMPSLVTSFQLTKKVWSFCFFSKTWTYVVKQFPLMGGSNRIHKG
ncbi:unnamed protein product [Lactuca virosa]|uniref:Uncharacterized protein n=1 Tax=Lactuca virosa TaxID=75947 RepID=A0AAU9LH65_9ASTR|nr:unnamed protein product [Lactuca virosa]